jgi:6-phosphogluconolactonase
MPNRMLINRRHFLKDCLIVTAGMNVASCRSTPATKPKTTAGRKSLLYIGTYADSNAESIFLYQMDATSGALKSLDSFKAGANPSFLALHPANHYLYAVNEIDRFQGQSGGAVSAYAIEKASGKLSLLNQQSSHGSGPCHVTVDRSGNFVLVANYGSGSVAVFPLSDDGRLGEASSVVQHQGHGANPSRQEGPHAHCIMASIDNRFVLSCDLGIDKVLVNPFDSANGQLLNGGEAALAPGAGPRHLDFSPDGRFVYVMNEMSVTVTVFAYAAGDGTLTQIQTLSSLPPGYSGSKSGAEIFVHPTGKFVYASNRGHDSIAIFSVDEGSGMLTLVGNESTKGKTPRNFVIDPSGTFLLVANQDSGTVVSFRIDAQNGTLSYLQTINVSQPVCLKIMAAEA